jgi:protein-disulfide isomerase
MASRKEQKEQARAARLAAEQQSAAQAQRNKRMYMFGGIIAVAVAIIAVVVIVANNGGTPAPTGIQTGHQANKTYNQVNDLLKDIPQNGTVLGNPKAKVTMTYFGDLQCPICRDFTLEVFPTFVQQEVRTGKVKVDYKSFCTASCNNTSQPSPQGTFNNQQVAAYAAGKQSLFWYYTELFYHEQGTEGTPYVNESFLTGLAGQIPNLNQKTWQTDRGDPALLTQVQADESLAAKDGIQGTPTLVMAGPKTEEIVQGSYNGAGFPSPSELEQAVTAVS